VCQFFGNQSKHQTDSKALRIFVGLVWFLETSHTVFLTHALYWLTVETSASQNAIADPLKNLSLASIMSGLSCSIIQIYFAFRAYKLSRRFVTPLVCVFLSLGHLVGQIILAIVGYFADSLEDWKNAWKWLILVITFASTIADILIAAMLSFELWLRRTMGVSSTPHRLVDRLITWCIWTCILTSVAMLTMIVLFLTMDNYAWIALHFVIPKIFSCCFLAALNGRRVLRKAGGKVEFVNVEASTAPLAPSTCGHTTISTGPIHDPTLSTDAPYNKRTFRCNCMQHPSPLSGFTHHFHDKPRRHSTEF